jgi:hypothetical protein
MPRDLVFGAVAVLVTDGDDAFTVSGFCPVALAEAGAAFVDLDWLSPEAAALVSVVLVVGCGLLAD